MGILSRLFGGDDEEEKPESLPTDEQIENGRILDREFSERDFLTEEEEHEQQNNRSWLRRFGGR